MSREQYFEYYYLIEALQGGGDYDIIARMESFFDSYGEIFGESGFRHFVAKEHCAYQTFLDILTSESFTFDYDELIFRYNTYYHQDLIGVLIFLAESPDCFASSKLNSMKICYFCTSPLMQTLIFQVLEKNAENLTSLEIRTRIFMCIRPLVFPKVQYFDYSSTSNREKRRK